ncbi:MD-2-related lipid-recognition protein ROSY1-like [Oryza brachyantha]|uniref:MD-2-related lipid-recognition domain-containing protein n=1 Tax=Oryza brachyantha TaxID=4533 RepID=J3LTI9_ORYBR|nr:MD-2-related lipid-recognition protein ROSY1-like [Oryza brachyantha]
MASSNHRRRVPVLLAAAAALLVVLLPAPAAATDVEYCKQGRDYPVKVSGVEIVPDPVISGQPATFKISASTDKSISKGKLVLDVKYFFFHVHSESHDLCDETSCPATGEFVLAHEQTLPSITPPGSYTITMKLLDDANKELTCISFGFSIGFLSPLSII